MGEPVHIAGFIKENQWPRADEELGVFGILDNLHRTIKAQLAIRPTVQPDVMSGVAINFQFVLQRARRLPNMERK